MMNGGETLGNHTFKMQIFFSGRHVSFKESENAIFRRVSWNTNFKKKFKNVQFYLLRKYHVKYSKSFDYRNLDYRNPCNTGIDKTIYVP